MQALVSRETSPLGTAVVSVTKQAAGEGAYNVIPETASFGGTIRSLSHDHLMQLKRRIDEVHLRVLCFVPSSLTAVCKCWGALHALQVYIGTTMVPIS